MSDELESSPAWVNLARTTDYMIFCVPSCHLHAGSRSFRYLDHVDCVSIRSRDRVCISMMDMCYEKYRKKRFHYFPRIPELCARSIRLTNSSKGLYCLSIVHWSSTWLKVWDILFTTSLRQNNNNNNNLIRLAIFLHICPYRFEWCRICLFIIDWTLVMYIYMYMYVRVCMFAVLWIGSFNCISFVAKICSRRVIFLTFSAFLQNYTNYVL